jgi:hypothetical protein
MVENTTTMREQIRYAIRFEKQLQTTVADLYGGEACNWPGAGDIIKNKQAVDKQTGREYYTEASANGTQFNGRKQITAELPTAGGIAVDGWKQGIERPLLAGMGYASVAGPSPDPQHPGFFRHFFVIPPQGKHQRPYTEEEAEKAGPTYSESDIINLYLCLSQEMGPYTEHLRNIAIKDFEISGSMKGPLQITMSGPSERIDTDHSKESANNWSTASGAFKEWYHMSDFKCYLSPVGEAMQSHSITDFSFKVSHGLADDNTPTGTSNNGLSRAEPLPAGKSTITLDITIYLHAKSLYEDWQKNETILQCELVAARGAYRFAILFPRLQITQTTINVDGASTIQLSMETSWPNSEDELAAIADSFAEERNGMEWPQTSVAGIIVTSKENRNPMRDMEG